MLPVFHSPHPALMPVPSPPLLFTLNTDSRWPLSVCGLWFHTALETQCTSAWPGSALSAWGWGVGKVRASARLSSRASHSSTADSRRADPRGAEDRRVWQWEERTPDQHCLDLVIYAPQAPCLPVHMAQHSCECLVGVYGSDICPGLLIFLCSHCLWFTSHFPTTQCRDRPLSSSKPGAPGHTLRITQSGVELRERWAKTRTDGPWPACPPAHPPR